MEDLPRVEMWCPTCNDYVRCRMFNFGNADLFKKTVKYGNAEPCPKCGNMITHEKKYLRYVDVNGIITEGQ